MTSFAPLLACLLAIGSNFEPEPTVAPAFTIPWTTLDAGGGVSSLGIYRLTGTAGQLDVLRLANGTTSVTGGFWVAGSGHPIFANGFESGGLGAWTLHVP